MGERMDVQQSPETPYLRARNTVMSVINMRLFKAWLQPEVLFHLTPYAKLQKENIDVTHKFADEVILALQCGFGVETTSYGCSILMFIIILLYLVLVIHI